MGALGRFLEGSWAPLGASWGVLGAIFFVDQNLIDFGIDFGPIWDPKTAPKRPWEALGASLETLGTALGRSWKPWGGSQGALGSLRGRKINPGPIRGGPGSPRAPPGWILHGLFMDSLWIFVAI